MKKNKKEIVITTEEWVKYLFTTPPKRPKNSITVDEIMRLTGKSRSHVINLLNNKVRKGELEKGKYVEGRSICNYYVRINIPTKK